MQVRAQRHRGKILPWLLKRTSFRRCEGLLRSTSYLAFRGSSEGQKAQTHHNSKFYNGGFPTHKIKKLVLRVKSEKKEKIKS